MFSPVFFFFLFFCVVKAKVGRVDSSKVLRGGCNILGGAAQEKENCEANEDFASW